MTFGATFLKIRKIYPKICNKPNSRKIVKFAYL